MVEDVDHEEGEIDDLSDFDEDTPSPTQKNSKQKRCKRKYTENTNGELLDLTSNLDDISVKKRKKTKEVDRQSPKKPQVVQKCKYFLEGRCNKGSGCQFSHDFIPPKKTELCRYYAAGNCNKGNSCLYFHEDFPCRYFNTSFCKLGDKCRFSHQKLTPETKEMVNQPNLLYQQCPPQNFMYPTQRPCMRPPPFGSTRAPHPRPLRMTHRAGLPNGYRATSLHGGGGGHPVGMHNLTSLARPPHEQITDTDFRKTPFNPSLSQSKYPEKNPAFNDSKSSAIYAQHRINDSSIKKTSEIDAIFETELDKMAAMLASNNNPDNNEKSVETKINGYDPRLGQKSTTESALPNGGGLPVKPVVWRLIKLDLNQRVPYLMMNISQNTSSILPDPRLKAGVNILANIPLSPIKGKNNDTQFTDKERSPVSADDKSILKSIESDSSKIINKNTPELSMDLEIDPPVSKPAAARKPFRLQLNEMASLGGSMESANGDQKSESQTSSNGPKSYLEDPRFRRRKILQPVADASNYANNDS